MLAIILNLTLNANSILQMQLIELRTEKYDLEAKLKKQERGLYHTDCWFLYFSIF